MAKNKKAFPVEINWSYNYSNHQVIKTESENWFGFSYYIGAPCSSVKSIIANCNSNFKFQLSPVLKTTDSLYHNLPLQQIRVGDNNFKLSNLCMFPNDVIDSIMFTGPIHNQKFKMNLSIEKFENKSFNVDALVDKAKSFKMNVLVDKPEVKKFVDTNKNNKILHIICPVLNPNTALYEREMLAVDSMTKQHDSHRVDLAVMATNNPNLKPFRFIQVKNQSNFVLLSEVLEQEYSYILYTNSDCQLIDGFYDRLFDIGLDEPTLFYRLNQSQQINSIFTNGIDGFLFSKEFYENELKKLPLYFYLGRPHWDTCLGNYLIENKMARSDCKSLIHLIHKIAWKSGEHEKLTKEERNNKNLWDEYLALGLMNFHELKFNPLKLSIVVVFFGTDELRINNAKKMLLNLKKQSVDYELVFVEGYYDKQNFDYLNGVENNIYIPLKLSECNKGLWQKECQMNIGAKFATCECIMFMDADLYVDDVNWLKKVVEAQDGSAVLQPWLFVEDDTSHQQYVSYIAANYHDVVSDVTHNPGMCFCVTKSMLEMNNYLNPYYIYGGGDSGFMYEYCQDETNFHLMITYNHLALICRYNTKKFKSNYLDFKLHHLNHGNVDNSYFENRHKGLESLNIMNNVEMFNGLLKWKNGSDNTKELINKVINSKKKLVSK